MQTLVNNALETIIASVKTANADQYKKEVIIAALMSINVAAILTPNTTIVKIKQLIPVLSNIGLEIEVEQLNQLCELLELSTKEINKIQRGAIIIALHETPVVGHKEIESMAELCAYCPEAETLVAEYVRDVTKSRIGAISSDITSLTEKLNEVVELNKAK